MEKLSKLAGLDHQNAIVFSVLNGEIKTIENKLDEYYSRFEKLERTVDWIGNYVEEQTVSDLEEEVKKKLGPIDRNDFLRQIYPKEKPMRIEDRIFSYFNETPDDERPG
uniref:Uncharacterized protein n=1 Tax=Rhizophagus irregularis (strain DAOM 181602 / DAOM 197198 / MUCL 43194) TaxID=747089 RepID=U9TF13_RHIID